VLAGARGGDGGDGRLLEGAVLPAGGRGVRLRAGRRETGQEPAGPAAGSEIADLIWEAPDQLTAEHGQAFQVAIRAHHAADTERAEQLWEKVRATWSQAWSANYAVLEFLQGTGLTRFSPAKPQQWVAASFEHHTSPHGLPRPHIHNIVITALTTRA